MLFTTLCLAASVLPTQHLVASVVPYPQPDLGSSYPVHSPYAPLVYAGLPSNIRFPGDRLASPDGTPFAGQFIGWSPKSGRPFTVDFTSLYLEGNLVTKAPAGSRIFKAVVAVDGVARLVAVSATSISTFDGQTWKSYSPPGAPTAWHTFSTETDLRSFPSGMGVSVLPAADVVAFAIERNNVSTIYYVGADRALRTYKQQGSVASVSLFPTATACAWSVYETASPSRTTIYLDGKEVSSGENHEGTYWLSSGPSSRKAIGRDGFVYPVSVTDERNEASDSVFRGGDWPNPGSFSPYYTANMMKNGFWAAVGTDILGKKLLLSNGHVIPIPNTIWATSKFPPLRLREGSDPYYYYEKKADFSVFGQKDLDTSRWPTASDQYSVLGVDPLHARFLFNVYPKTEYSRLVEKGYVLYLNLKNGYAERINPPKGWTPADGGVWWADGKAFVGLNPSRGGGGGRQLLTIEETD